MQLKPSPTPLAGRGHFGSGLHDTRLEPTDRPPDLPVGCTTGAAPASISAADISACLPESVGHGSLVMKDPREVSPLSRRGDLVRGRTHPLSTRLPSGLSLFPHPSSAASSASFTVRLPLRGDNGVTSFIFGITRELGRAYRPVVHHPRRGTYEPQYLTTYLFGPSLTASLACLGSRPLSALHLD